MNQKAKHNPPIDSFRRLASGTAALSSVNVSEKLVAFFLLPIFTYYLSPKDYGIIAMVGVTSTFFVLLCNSGMMTAVGRKYWDTDVLEEKKNIIGSGFLFFLGGPIVVAVLVLFWGNSIFSIAFDDFEFMPYGVLAIASSIMLLPTRLWSTVWVYQHKVKSVAIWSIGRLLIGVCCSLLLVVCFKLGALGRLTGMIVGQFVLFVFACFALSRYTRGKFSINKIGQLFAFGSPLIIGIWAYSVLDMIDKYLLERMVSIESVGIYAIGYRFGSLPMMIIAGYKRAWSPIFFENMNSGNYSTLSKLSTYYTLILTTFCAALVLFSGEFIHLFVNHRFYEAETIIPWIACGICFLGLLAIPEGILVYENRLAIVSYISTGLALFNVGSNLLMIPRFGIIGAAGATFLSYLGYLIVTCLLAGNRLVKLVELKRAAIPIIFMLFSLVFSLVVKEMTLATSTVILFLKVLYIFTWPLALYFMGYFTDSELQHGKDMLRRLNPVRGLLKRK